MAEAALCEVDFLAIPCPVCGTETGEEIYPARLGAFDGAFDYLHEEDAHYRIVRCSGCAQVYSSPILRPERIERLYAECDLGAIVEDETASSVCVNMGRYLRRLRGVSGKQSGALLDIGCGTGALLSAAAAMGYAVTGIEPSAQAVAHARTVCPSASVIEGVYDELSFAPESFDLVTLIHVIDHVPDPCALVSAMARHLKPGGLCVLATHNIRSLLARVMGESFIAYSIQHICYFDPGSLCRLLARCGLEPVAVKRSLTTYTLRHYAENGLRQAGLRDAVLRVFDALRLGGFPLTFPFGNFEVYARKPAPEGSAS